MPTASNGCPGLHEGPNQPTPFTRAVVLGIYDGATEGVLQVGDGGPVYLFGLPDGVDEGKALTATERPFDLRPLPRDALDRIVSVLAEFQPPTFPIWYPGWQYPTDQIAQDVLARVDSILAEAGPVEWRITTPDPWGFSSVRAERVPAGQGA